MQKIKFVDNKMITILMKNKIQSIYSLIETNYWLSINNPTSKTSSSVVRINSFGTSLLAILCPQQSVRNRVETKTFQLLGRNEDLFCRTFSSCFRRWQRRWRLKVESRKNSFKNSLFIDQNCFLLFDKI